MSRIAYDLEQPEFREVDKQILGALMDKHEQYEVQGRDLEATAMQKAFRIVKRNLKGDFEDTQPTGWGSL